MGGAKRPAVKKRLQPGRAGMNRHGENPGQASLPGVADSAHNVTKFPKKEAANA